MTIFNRFLGGAQDDSGWGLRCAQDDKGEMMKGEGKREKGRGRREKGRREKGEKEYRISNPNVQCRSADVR